MKIKSIIISVLCFVCPFFSFAQGEKYLGGAVPEVDGKVVFEKKVTLSGFSREQIFDHIMLWTQKRFGTDAANNGRILISEKESGEIVVWGDEDLVFLRTALSLDMCRVNYQLSIQCEDEMFYGKVMTIRYFYDSDGTGKREKIVAEDMITDKIALNKKGDRLYKVPGKFRRSTIDMVEQIWEDLENHFLLLYKEHKQLMPKKEFLAPREEVINIDQIQALQGEELEGYKKIAPEKIPGNIIKMLTDDWMLICAGSGEEFNMMTASWGGLGRLYNKPVAFCFIHPNRHTYQLMDNDSTYTLTFYTETYREVLNYCGTHSGKEVDKVKATGLTLLKMPSGSRAFSEAWMIVECKKMVAQPLLEDALYDPEIKAERGGKPLHKMFIGEILNVWVK